MTDSAETMLEALRLLAAEDDRQSKLHELLEVIREQIRCEVAPEHRPDGLFRNIQDAVYAMRGRTPLTNDMAIVAALSASGTKSEIDEAGLERAVRECARITAPEITDAEYEAIRRAKEPRYLNTCAEMRRALIAYLGEAGEASTKPGPSDPISSQPDEREAIARIIDPRAWRVMDGYLEQTRRKYRGQNVSWPVDQFQDKASLAKADAILAMLAERRDFTCAARKQSLPEPADCDWPVCGCDPYADKVIAALEESGALKDQSQHPAPIAGLEPVAWEYRWPDGEYTWTRRKPSCLDGYHPRYSAAQLEAHAAEQVRAEREVCAAIADVQYDEAPSSNSYDNGGSTIGWMEASRTIAAAIRARGAGVSLTKEQRHVMRSALGLNMRDYEYRNHFAASSVDAKIWDGLCKLGFAELYGQGGGTLHLKYYHVTDAGRRALAEAEGK